MFYVCKHCGNVVELVVNKGVPVVCCGEKMHELVPNTVEASIEKHLPVINVNGDVIDVNVGGVEHPMEAAHNIGFVYVETEKGGQRKSLEVGKPPKAVFSVKDDKPIAVYAYCNLHGLWKTEI